MKRYNAYFFDLYGTLADIHTDESEPAFWRGVASCYAAHGAAWEAEPLRQVYLTLCAAEEARLQAAAPQDAFVELDLTRVFAALYLQKGVTRTPGLMEETAWFFRRSSTSHLRVYAGARELLLTLRTQGREVILLSNAQACFTRPELDALGLTDCFDRIFISSEIGFKKPDPRFFGAALEASGQDPADCLMIGNDPVCDVEGAIRAGMDAFYIHSNLSPRPRPELAALPVAGSLPRMDLRALRRLLSDGSAD